MGRYFYGSKNRSYKFDFSGLTSKKVMKYVFNAQKQFMYVTHMDKFEMVSVIDQNRPEYTRYLLEFPVAQVRQKLLEFLETNQFNNIEITK